MNFADKTVIVTGAAGNLGRAVANTFAEQGANLVLVGRHRESLEAQSPATRKRLIAATDLLDPDAIRSSVDTALKQFGRIDVLCNIAGGFRMGEAVHEASDKNVDFLYDINVRTLLHMVRAVTPHMIAAGGGKIINIGAYAAQKGGARMGPYIAAKAAVIRLTESMAMELREKHINVNCVLPTIIDTPENRASMPKADPARWVSPQALANVIAFLASDAAKAVHGAALPVTGLS